MCLHQKQTKLCIRALVPLVIVLSVSGFAADAPAAEPQKAVLALYGSRPDLPSNVIVDEILRSTLERELGPRLDFYAEFLDTARWPEGEVQIAVRDFLRRRYAKRKLSVIIAVARPAINFMHIYGDELFPGVPIVAYGDSDALRDWQPGRPITGALAKVDLSRTVELILRLQPGTREILVISGASDSDRWRQSEARRQLDQLEKRVKLTYMDAGSVQDFVTTAARVPDGTVILFLSMYQDSAGNKLLNHEVLARIAKEARVPVYNQTATHVGLGIVGGVVFDPEILGLETAQIALRVLRGERLQDLPVQESKSTVPMVDWRQLRRWGLDEKRLPAGTVVRFREASVWESYKAYILSGISLILAETLLIFGLVWQRAKRKKVETELGVTYDRLRHAVEAGKCVGWEWDVKTGRDRWFGDLQTMFGIQSDTYDGNVEEFRRRIYPEDQELVWKAFADARRNREPFIADFRVLRIDGTVRWVTERGQFYYAANGDAVRMLGMAVDITERKLAEESLADVGRKMIEAHEEERTWLARELHDDVNQRMALLAIELDRWNQQLPPSAVEFHDHIHHASQRLSDIAADIQALSHRLHSSKLEYLGIVAAAKTFCTELSEQQKVEIDFSHTTIPRSVPKEISLCLFRVLQETLQNAVKHSGVRQFKVELHGTEREIQLTVSDLGVGFDPQDAIHRRGLGLISMRERMQLVSGEISIKSHPGSGTTIRARIPLKTDVYQAMAG
jgi:PAS domain S-box-containing protein